MSCCCVDYDANAVVVGSTDIKKARTPHTCGECRRTIPPGAPYRREAVESEGSVETHKTCVLCLSVRGDRLSCGFAWGYVWSDIRDCLAEYDDDGDAWLDPPDWPIEVTP